MEAVPHSLRAPVFSGVVIRQEFWELQAWATVTSFVPICFQQKVNFLYSSEYVNLINISLQTIQPSISVIANREFHLKSLTGVP